MIQIGWGLVFTIINLLLLAILMRIFLFKPVMKIIEERQKQADAQLDEIKQTKEDADALKSQYEAAVKGIDQEKKNKMADARKAANKEYERIVNDANKKAQQIREDAEIETENRKAQILKNAEKEIADMVLDAAEKVVGAKQGAEIDHALYEEFLGKAGDES